MTEAEQAWQGRGDEIAEAIGNPARVDHSSSVTTLTRGWRRLLHGRREFLAQFDESRNSRWPGGVSGVTIRHECTNARTHGGPAVAMTQAASAPVDRKVSAMTDAQRMQFERDGYLLVRGALGESEVAAYAAALDLVYAAQQD